jgi:hypothetical protein
MTKERQSPPAGPTPEAPITLDALAAQVSLLAEAVGRLTAAEQSPDIPHEAPTGEEVVDMAEHDDSIIVKAGSKTYFFDLKQTRDNKPYLLLTESRFKGEGEERERVSITIFPESAAPFGQAVAEMVARLSEPVAGRE